VGRERSVKVREVLNAIFNAYGPDGGSKAFLKGLSLKTTLSDYVGLWNSDGTWQVNVPRPTSAAGLERRHCNAKYNWMQNWRL
jgi:hypothetical protein